jgi:hypothetical protein
MKKQITRISVHQTSLVFALLQTLISFLFIGIPVFVYDSFHQQIGLGIVELIFIPILYFFFTYIALAIAFFFYNYIVKYTGGAEVEVSEASSLPRENINK